MAQHFSRRQGLADRLGSELGEGSLQGADAGREQVFVTVVKLLDKSGDFFVVKVHGPDMGRQSCAAKAGARLPIMVPLLVEMIARPLVIPCKAEYQLRQTLDNLCTLKG